MDLRRTLEDNSLWLGVAMFLVLALFVGAASQSSLLGYSSSPQDAVYNPDLEASGEYDRDLQDSGGGTDVEERKKATTYSVSLEVPDVREAQSETQSIAESYGGYTDSTYFNRDRTDSGSLTVRVPENNASEFVSELESKWVLESSNTNSRDVTDQYTELELELENRRQELDRLESMMNETSDVDSLIKIQERMSDLRSRIQYLESRLEDLDERVDYTRVRIDFSEPEPLTAEFDLRESFADAYRGVFSSMDMLIVGTGKLLPFLLVAGFIYGLRRRLKG